MQLPGQDVNKRRGRGPPQNWGGRDGDDARNGVLGIEGVCQKGEFGEICTESRVKRPGRDLNPSPKLSTIPLGDLDRLG